MTETGGRQGTALRRTLYLVGQFGYGGSERQLFRLLANMNREKWLSHVLVFHPSPNGDHSARLRELGVVVIHLPSRIRTRLGKLLFTWRTARRVKPDVIHSWSVHDNPYAMWAGRFAGVKLCWGSVRSSTSLPGFRSLPSWYRRHALRSVDRLVVNSRSIADELSELGIREGRVMLLPNCVETENSVGLRVEMTGFTDLGFDLSHHVFGCVGNIRKAKNQALFVRAMVQVVARHPDARGVVIGETLAGEEEARIEVEREIERLGLAGRVVLTGFREDVQSLMPHLAALCLTSESEGMPNVVLEAMAAGVPVVATAVGGVPEIVADGSTGWLVPAGDEAAFANAMCRVLEAPEEALQMAGEAKARVEEEHNCPAMARRLEAAYAEALEVGGLA